MLLYGYCSLCLYSVAFLLTKAAISLAVTRWSVVGFLSPPSTPSQVSSISFHFTHAIKYTQYTLVLPCPIVDKCYSVTGIYCLIAQNPLQVSQMKTCGIFNYKFLPDHFNCSSYDIVTTLQVENFFIPCFTVINSSPWWNRHCSHIPSTVSCTTIRQDYLNRDFITSSFAIQIHRCLNVLSLFRSSRLLLSDLIRTSIWVQSQMLMQIFRFYSHLPIILVGSSNLSASNGRIYSLCHIFNECTKFQYRPAQEDS